MIDVMVKPEVDDYAEETATVIKYYAYHPEDRKAKARAAILRITERLRTDTHQTDAAIEELWNILVGNN